MSTPAIQYSGPVISSEVPWETRRHLQLLYQKLGNHTQAFQFQAKQIAALKPGSTTTSIEEIGGGSSAGPITAVNIGMVNDQAGEASYATQVGDYGALIVLNDSAAVAVTLTSATPPFFCFLLNEGAGTVTLTPSPGTINGASTLTLLTGDGAIVFFDATDWEAIVNSVYTPLGGATGSRPSSPPSYTSYFDTTLGYPVWWSGSEWVNSAGFPA